ncbi:MAG: hypothetical protein HYZ57_04400 [Acidobacteria bacterium]|nr:hypothetical protein [Acidobacteriota bacterium]
MRIPVACGLALLLVLPAEGADKKKKKNGEEETTQVLPAPREPPMVVTADVERLVFQVSPLSPKGLLSQQTRNALKAIFKASRGDTIVRLRAFVASSGDLRRVKEIVSEEFGDKRLGLPVVSTVQVGALPLEGAQVVIESAAVDKKVLHPNGLAFISGQVATTQNPLGPLETAVRNASLPPDGVLRVTCFLGALNQVAPARARAKTAFPKAVVNFVQLQRGSVSDFAECEAVAALPTPVGERVKFVNPIAGRYSQIALLSPGKIALSGLQLGFRAQENDIRLAFQRLEKALEPAGTSLKHTAFSNLYPLTRSTTEIIRKVRQEFFDKAKPPASTMVLFEGLPSLDASFGIDVLAVLR